MYFPGFLKYFFNARGLHSIHSPFVYELVSKVIYDTSSFKEYTEIENIRHSILKMDELIQYEDYGANPGIYTKKISELAQTSAVSPKWGQLLFRLSRWFQPATVLEIGTSLGLGTSYISRGCGMESQVFTLEGSATISKIAREIFIKQGLNQIVALDGKAEDILEAQLIKMPSPDFIFIDANHRMNPTLQYFDRIIKYASPHAVFIFDDIFWSREMYDAWAILCSDERLHVTITLSRMGLAFIRDGQAKENFIVRF